MKAIAAALLAVSGFAVSGAATMESLEFEIGRALFERDWIPAPASTDAADGLGPLYAARSCAACHSGPSLGSRFTAAPEGRIAGRGVILRFGDQSGRPDPTYGRQLQTLATPGLLPEGRVILVSDREGGLAFSLHLDRGPLDASTRTSLRQAPPLRGRGALERISADAVLAIADPDDRDGDGISGRARFIGAPEESVIGRYGWKASNADLPEQVAEAFALELGLSSAERPLPHGDCTAVESDCLAAPTGQSERFGGHELSAEMIGAVVAYLRGLPSTRRTNDMVGATLFAEAGCAACHVPELPAIGGGSVAAYTDLLLHDMGHDLDDGLGAPGVASSEWRTAPLIAMAPALGRRYLHDGRAASVEQAVREHGGEAAAALSHYLELGEEERKALVAFVEAL